MKARERTRRPRRTGAVGQLVKQWRERRRMSQLGLAIEADISARHLSFVETGRTRPSREMVMHLSRALDVPPRARNELLRIECFFPADAATETALRRLAA